MEKHCCKLILGHKGTGKTTYLVKLASEKDACIVCLNKKRVQYVWSMARDMGVIIRYPLTVDEAISYKGQSLTYMIDDVGEVLIKLFGHSGANVNSFVFGMEDIELVGLSINQK